MLLTGCNPKKTTVFLIIVYCLYIGTAFVHLSYSTNQLSGYNYRKQIYLDGSGTTVGSNYQILLYLHYGEGLDNNNNIYLDEHCKANFDDVRFTDNSGINKLSYYIQNYYEEVNATIWVKVSANLTDSIEYIYVYYGNSEASNESNIYTTFVNAIENITVGLHCDEGLGSVTYDFSGYDNDASINGATWSLGKYSYGLDYDGTNDYLNISNSATVNFTSDFTVLAWINTDTISGNDAIVAKDNAGIGDGFWLYLYDGNVSVEARYGVVWDVTRCNFKVSTDTYYLVGFTYDGVTTRIYVNGYENITEAHSGDIQTNAYDLRIGVDERGNTDLFDGLIDEVFCFEQVLNATEMLQIYENYATAKISEGFLTIRKTPESILCSTSEEEQLFESLLWYQDFSTFINYVGVLLAGGFIFYIFYRRF